MFLTSKWILKSPVSSFCQNRIIKYQWSEITWGWKLNHWLFDVSKSWNFSWFLDLDTQNFRNRDSWKRISRLRFILLIPNFLGYGGSGSYYSNRGSAGFGSSGAYISHDKFSKAGSKLRPVDWKNMKLVELKKDCYKEHTSVSGRDQSEIDKFITENDVYGTHTPRPIFHFIESTFPGTCFAVNQSRVRNQSITILLRNLDASGLRFSRVDSCD